MYIPSELIFDTPTKQILCQGQFKYGAQMGST